MWLHTHRLLIMLLWPALLIAAIGTAASTTSTPTLAQPLAQATAAPTLAAPSPQQILDRSQALTYTWALIRSRTYEPRSNWDAAAYASVVFPNGDQGAFVALGTWGVASGYQVLYRIHDGKGEQVGTIRTNSVVWGIRRYRTEAPADIEFLTLFADAQGRPVAVLKVTGAGHHGTGLWDYGVFEILVIADDGLRQVFWGQETRVAVGTRTNLQIVPQDQAFVANKRDVCDASEDGPMRYATPHQRPAAAACRRARIARY
jgi:hypothetical protein